MRQRKDVVAACGSDFNAAPPSQNRPQSPRAWPPCADSGCVTVSVTVRDAQIFFSLSRALCPPSRLLAAGSPSGLPAAYMTRHAHMCVVCAAVPSRAVSNSMSLTAARGTWPTRSNWTSRDTASARARGERMCAHAVSRQRVVCGEGWASGERAGPVDQWIVLLPVKGSVSVASAAWARTLLRVRTTELTTVCTPGPPGTRGSPYASRELTTW